MEAQCFITKSLTQNAFEIFIKMGTYAPHNADFAGNANFGSSLSMLESRKQVNSKSMHS